MGDLLLAAVVIVLLVSVPLSWKRPRGRRRHAEQTTGTTLPPGGAAASDDAPKSGTKSEPRNFWEEFGDTHGGDAT